MNYMELCLGLLKGQDIQDKVEILESIEILKNMLLTNQGNHNIVIDIYNKYKDDIKKVNDIKMKNSQTKGEKNRTHDIYDKNNLHDTIVLLIDSLYRVLLYKFFKNKFDENTKELFILKEDKDIYELLSGLIK